MKPEEYWKKLFDVIGGRAKRSDRDFTVDPKMTTDEILKELNKRKRSPKAP